MSFWGTIKSTLYPEVYTSDIMGSPFFPLGLAFAVLTLGVKWMTGSATRVAAYASLASLLLVELLFGIGFVRGSEVEYYSLFWWAWIPTVSFWLIVTAAIPLVGISTNLCRWISVRSVWINSRALRASAYASAASLVLLIFWVAMGVPMEVESNSYFVTFVLLALFSVAATTAILPILLWQLFQLRRLS